MRSYYIAENKVTAQKNSLTITDKLNERTTCSFVVVEPDFSIDVGMEVVVEDNGIVIFAGAVDNVSAYGDKVKYVAVSCVDYSQLVDKRIIAEAYDNMTAGDMVREFIQKVFAEEGITEGNVQNGPVISKAVFNYLDGNTALNYLAEVTGYYWFIDNEKRLHFFDRSTHTAPFELSDTSYNYKDLQVKRTRSQYRNRQYIRAGTDISQEIVKEKPTPKPDGTSRTFVVRLPIAMKPRIYIDGNEIPEEEIGVNGLDKDRKYYFSYNSNTITQDNSEPVLTDGQVIEVTYRGLYPLLIVAEDSGQISERQAIEGGSGIHENIIQEQNINTRDAALEFASGKLAMYGMIPKIVSFNTYQLGLRAGQLITINNTMHGLSGAYLIESITARDDNGLTLYSVKCLDGSALGGWEQLFKSLIQGNKKLVIRENEVLVKLITMTDTFTVPKMEDEMTYRLHQYHICGQIICGTDVII